MKLKIDAIKVGERFRQDMGDIEGLAKSIQEIGLIQPIVVDEDNELVAGGRRLAAIKSLGLEEVEITRFAGDVLVAQQDENERRKGFTTTEKLQIAEAIRKQIEKGHVVPPTDVRRNQFVAEQAGFDSEGTMIRAGRVAREGAPELVDAMDKGEVTVGAATELLVLPKEQQAKTVKDGKAKETAAKIRKAKPKKEKKEEAPQPVIVENDESDSDGEQASELLDGEGNTIPSNLEDVFGDPSFKTLVDEVGSFNADLLRQMQRVKGFTKSKYYPHAKFGECLKQIAAAMEAMANAESLLKNGMPHCVCQECGGNNKKCQLCYGHGYLTKHMHDTADQYGG